MAYDEMFDEPADSDASKLDLHKILDIVRRRRRVFFWVLPFALIPALVLPFTAPVVYESVAKISIQEMPEVMQFGEGFMPLAPRSFQALAPAMAIMMSDQVLGRVAEQLPSDSGDQGPGLGERLSTWAGLGDPDPGRSVSPELKRRMRIEQIRSTITLTEAGGGTILQVQALSFQAPASAFIANAVADAFVQYEIEQRHDASSTAITWLNRKASELREEIRRRDRAMGQLVADGGVVPHESDPSNIESRGRLYTELETTRRELLAVEGQIAESAPRVRRAAAPTAEVRALQGRYREARDQLDTARLRFRETHPEVQRLTSVVRELSERLGPNRVVPGPSVSPDRLRAYEDLVDERSRLRARVQVLDRALDDLVASTADNADASADYERLERESSLDRQMLEVILTRTNETIVNAANDTAPARVLDYAIEPLHPVSPGRRKYLLLGFMMAIGAAAGTAMAFELMDRTVYDAEVVGAALDAPVLASIPLVTDGTAAERLSSLERPTLGAESFRNLRTSLLFQSGRGGLRSLLVASGVAGEGKTTVATNLAASFGQTGRRVLLVDADLRRPRVHKVLALSAGPGLAEVLRGEIAYKDAVRPALGLRFDVLTSGAVPTNPVDLLGSASFDELLQDLQSVYDLVVIDAPVLLAVSDALLLASRAQALLFVSKPGMLDKSAFARISSDLKRARAHVIGVVSNQVDAKNAYQYPSYLHSPYVKHEAKSDESDDVKRA